LFDVGHGEGEVSTLLSLRAGVEGGRDKLLNNLQAGQGRRLRAARARTVSSSAPRRRTTSRWTRRRRRPRRMSLLKSSSARKRVIGRRCDGQAGAREGRLAGTASRSPLGARARLFALPSRTHRLRSGYPERMQSRGKPTASAGAQPAGRSGGCTRGRGGAQAALESTLVTGGGLYGGERPRSPRV
jgi:hypothetical protein